MKRVVISSPFNIDLEEADIPDAGIGELLIKAKISGISSGTEMMLYRGTYPNLIHKKWHDGYIQFPIYPGYELVGVIEEIGKEEKPTLISFLGNYYESPIQTGVYEFKKGDRVVCMGVHAEYAVVPAKLAVKIPDNISDKQATSAILATTAFHCIQKAQIKFGEVVTVIGMGLLGLMTLQSAKIAGASKVIAIDLDNNRLDIAKRAGADLCLNPKDCDIVKEINNYTKIGSDVIIEVTGGAKNILKVAIDLIRDGGRIVLLGWHTEDIPFSFGDYYSKEAKIILSRAIGFDSGIPYTSERFTSDISLRIVMDLISNGRIKTNIFQPVIFSYKDIKKVYEIIDKNPSGIGLQAIIDWES